MGTSFVSLSPCSKVGELAGKGKSNFQQTERSLEMDISPVY